MVRRRMCPLERGEWQMDRLRNWMDLVAETGFEFVKNTSGNHQSLIGQCYQFVLIGFRVIHANVNQRNPFARISAHKAVMCSTCEYMKTGFFKPSSSACFIIWRATFFHCQSRVSGNSLNFCPSTRAPRHERRRRPPQHSFSYDGVATPASNNRGLASLVLKALAPCAREH